MKLDSHVPTTAGTHGEIDRGFPGTTVHGARQDAANRAPADA